MPGIRTFYSLDAAMRAGYEAYDAPQAGRNYWLVRTQTARGWALAIAFEVTNNGL
jgi:hypothetical protein